MIRGNVTTTHRHDQPAMFTLAGTAAPYGTAVIDGPYRFDKCRRLSRRWGFGGLVVRNLYAWRARHPADLADAADPVGPDNDAWLTRWDGVDQIVVARGTGRWPWLGDRAAHGAALLAPHRPVCLRTCRDDQPAHPLYQREDLEPAPWPHP